MKAKKRSVWMERIGCGICTLLVTYALLCSLEVQAVSEELSGGLWHTAANILTALWKSMPEETLLSTLAFAGLYWLARRFLHLGRCGIGEWILSLFTAFWMLGQKCFSTDDTGLRLLIGYRTQLLKGMLCYAGFTLLSLTLVHLLDEAARMLRQGGAFRFRHPVRTPLLILLCCWVPVMILQYPGVLYIDTFHQILETERGFGGHNPPVLSVLYGQAVMLGDRLFGKAQLGLYLLLLLQCVLMGCAMLRTLWLVQRRGARKAGVIGLTVYFALSPVLLSLMTTHRKDAAYAMCFLMFMTETAILLLDTPAWWDCALWALSGTGGLWTRQNAVAVLIPAMLITVIVLLCRKQNALKKLLCALCAVVSIAAGIGVPQLIVTEQDPSAVRDTLSLPLQMTAQVLREHTLPQEEMDIIRAVADPEGMKAEYDYYSADRVKGNFRSDASTEEIIAFVKLWGKLVLRYPLDAANAAAGLACTVFSPLGSDAVLYTHTYSGWLGGINVTEWWDTPLSGPDSLLFQGWQLLLRSPLAGLCANIGLFGFITLWMLLRAKRTANPHGTRTLLVPLLLTMIVLAFSPVAYTRYALPLMASVPPVMLLMCTEMKDTDSKHIR